MQGRRLGDENTIFAEILASLSLLTGAHPLKGCLSEKVIFEDHGYGSESVFISLFAPLLIAFIRIYIFTIKTSDK